MVQIGEAKGTNLVLKVEHIQITDPNLVNSFSDPDYQILVLYAA